MRIVSGGLLLSGPSGNNINHSLCLVFIFFLPTP